VTGDTAEQMRELFDRSFAAPRIAAGEAHAIFIAIRIAGDRYALPMGELAGLARDRKVVRVPSPVAELIGVAGLRGEPIAVHSLAAWLGRGRETNPRWLALCGEADRVGLAFGDIEGQLQALPEQILQASGVEHVRGWLRTGDVTRAVLHVGSILEAIRRRCGDARASKER